MWGKKTIEPEEKLRMLFKKSVRKNDIKQTLFVAISPKYYDLCIYVMLSTYGKKVLQHIL